MHLIFTRKPRDKDNTAAMAKEKYIERKIEKKVIYGTQVFFQKCRFIRAYISLFAHLKF